MGLDPDEIQEWRNLNRKMSHQVKILREVLLADELPEDLVDTMILEYWRVSIAHAFTPNLSEIFGKITGTLDPEPEED